MPAPADLLNHVYVKVDGTDVSRQVQLDLISAEVDDSLHLPDMFTLHLRDPRLDWVEGRVFAIGKKVEISVHTASGPVKLMTGEITALELSFSHETGPTLLVRGFDQAHRLHRGRQTRSFLNATDSDIARQIAGDVGLTPRVDATSGVHEYVLQDNQTNLEFLNERAQRIGYLVLVEERTLHFVRAPSGAGAAPVLEWGLGLVEFHAQLSTAHQVSEVLVRGWDPATKREIIGRATRGQSTITVGERRQGGETANNAFGAAGREVIVDRTVATQAEATDLAQAALNEIAASFIQAEGVCRGDPQVSAGNAIELRGLGPRFSGRYRVAHALHRYDAEGYRTHFTISNRQSSTIAELLAPATSGRREGVVVGVVTNNRDPQEWGRVKVQFPWLADRQESTWARVASPMAGPERGLFILPEVNDEVLVAFEHGDPHRPYVLGALWNGRDKPPDAATAVSSTGQVQKRLLKTRAGHTILLDDSDAGGVTIVDKNGNKVVIDSSQNKMTLEALGDLSLKARGRLTIEGAQVEVSGQGPVTVKGATINLN